MPIELISSQGVLLKVKTGGTFQLIDGVTDLSRSGGEKETINGTALSDTAPRSKGGFPSPVIWEATVNYNPVDTVHAALDAAKAAGTSLIFQITLPAETPIVRYFDAEVTDFGNFSMSQNSIVNCPMRLAQDGALRTTE